MVRENTNSLQRVWGARSLTNLRGVHPDMVRLATRALAICAVDFTVIEGLRDLARQHQLYGYGRTPAQLTKVGVPAKYSEPTRKRVTDTLKSNHLPWFDGGNGVLLGTAIDTCHIVNGVPVWDDCRLIAAAFRQASEELRIPYRWGADWNRNGQVFERGEYDGPHFELFQPRRLYA